jgi:hypothetical protein
MAAYMTRVVLHKVSDLRHDAYARLHAAMTEQGFERVVSGSTGKVHLPPAEYRHPNAADQDQVLTKAKAAASSVDPDYGIIVMGDWLTSAGLKPVT